MDLWIFVGLTLILIAFLILRTKKPKYLKTLSEEEFKQNYRKAQLIDIREEKEFKTGHILGARNIPLSQLKRRAEEIRPDMPVYMYCQNGSKTAQAAKILRKKRGVQDLASLQGGFKKWTGKIKK
ncbi:rhodanese-like domain-containing protein [Salisediminibacterium halotolerans]|uniref:Rhodanese-related sulfurtransferase n=1 Tax=Salisediminibacterium halotolerans TaxID=517425 RepID=A0A1H9SCK9_9BACI|nr:rhodanese-like domain-containing protein [Salisediminibacterium haloalkalitolerans]SER82658.1 Rhodanese-related sulfurtransferase [Salisediminibacterium haloalkalitolerans]